MCMHGNNPNTAPQHGFCHVHTSPHMPAALQVHGQQLWLFREVSPSTGCPISPQPRQGGHGHASSCCDRTKPRCHLQQQEVTTAR